MIIFGFMMSCVIARGEIQETKNKAMFRATQISTMVFDTLYRAMEKGSKKIEEDNYNLVF